MPQPACLPQVYRLTNPIRNYDWGSYTDISSLLGVPSSGNPEAELWLGAHASAPSLTQPWDDAAASPLPLDQLIQQFPQQMLGTRVLDAFGPRLPYLLKVLAADRALSLQVHPAAHLARAGFNRENREQIPLDAPERVFHDANHKPEMVVAVTEFHALAGLRAPRVVLRMLDGLSGVLFDVIRNAISAAPNHLGLRSALTELLAWRGRAELPAALTQALTAIRARLAAGSQYQVADQTALDLAEQYPGDVGALSSYLLNRVTLLPGEALFMDDGEAHAYLKGVGVEVMSNSDNVLRAGLTTKHVDIPALLECMSFQPRMPHRPEQYELGHTSRAVTYRVPVEEFALTVFDVHEGEPLPISQTGPRIVQILEGVVTLSYGGATGLHRDTFINPASGRPMSSAIPKITGIPLRSITLSRGDSVFLPDAVGPAELAGFGQAVCAWVP